MNEARSIELFNAVKDLIELRDRIDDILYLEAYEKGKPQHKLNEIYETFEEIEDLIAETVRGFENV